MNICAPIACFFCGVDSRALLYFFILFVVCTVLAALSLLLWSISKGEFNKVEQPKHDIFNEADDDLGVQQPGRIKPVNRP